MEMKFERYGFAKRLSSMLKVDFRRMFTMPFVYLMLGISLVVPVLILVMTTMMDGTVSVNPQTGEETVMEAFDSAWEIIGSVTEESEPAEDNAQMSMDMMSMCNINLLYFGVAVLVCVFTAADFRSGYAKNLFTVRSKKSDYVISKTVVCTVGGALMIAGFFAGTILGGAIAGLPLEMTGFDVYNVLMCMLSKMLLMSVFVPIYLLMSVIAKQKLWLSILLSLMVGMFLFMMVPMLSPLDSTVMNVLLCFVGGVVLASGLGAISNQVLKKSSLV